MKNYPRTGPECTTNLQNETVRLVTFFQNLHVQTFSVYLVVHKILQMTSRRLFAFSVASNVTCILRLPPRDDTKPMEKRDFRWFD